MAETLQIVKWKAEGLRCPDHEINFLGEGDRVKPITLIQMPNGTGKTTTLELLRAALSGAASEGQWSREKVISLAKKGNAKGTGSFQVVLLNNQSKRVTIIMSFDFDAGTVRYTTTVQSGRKEGFYPPGNISRFLRPDFVPFFVFDGELAERLLSRDHTNAQEAVEVLFQLKVFSLLRERVQQYWEDQVRSCGAKEEKGLNRRQNRVALLMDRLSKMKEQQEEAKKKFTEVEQQLLKKRNKFKAAIAKQGRLNERFTAAETKLSQARSEVQSSALGVMSLIRAPQAISKVFAQEMITLKASLDRVKLPESTAREFFEELAEEAQCICGRELDEQTRHSIRNRAAQYLGSDDVSLLNSIKGDISEYVGLDPVVRAAELSTKIDSLKQLIRREQEAQTARDRIQSEGVGQDPALEAVQTDISDLDKELKKLGDECEKYDDMSDTARDEEIFGIKVLERRLDDAERMLAEATQTKNLKKKRDIIQQILTVSWNEARERISTDLCVSTNQRIAALMPDNAIRVEKIDRNLVLQDQDGGSVGETLSVAYAFLATLFNRADHQLPFIVDSPANPIDLRVRSKVAELIPRLTNQFIAFTISSERDGFLTPLEHATVKDGIQYLTLFRKGTDDLAKLASGEASVQESSDGICVTGRKFFRSVHVDQESTNAPIPS